MPSGSCLCGNLKYEYTGDPAMKVLCHCLTCRKLTGGTNSVCVLIPEDKLKFTSGTPKMVETTHETGMPLHIRACPDCGCATGKVPEADAYRGLYIVFAGTLDDQDGLAKAAPDAELWVKYRPAWLPEIKGAQQCQTFT